MDYTSIRVSTLRGDQKIDFNAYLKINEKMILYLRSGDHFDGERLKRLKEKKLKKMFILATQEPSYRSYLDKNIQMAYDNSSGKDLSTRVEIIQGQQQSHTEEVFENPENATAYASAKNAAGAYVQFLLTNTDAVGTVLKMENADQNVAHHGVSVATLAVALAEKLGINTPAQVQLLALGGLLHDMGHTDSGMDIARPRSSFNAEEKALYEQHPARSAERVRDKKHFDAQVIRIISQHEETLKGTGFPGRLQERELDPMSLIVGAANALDRLLTFEKVPRLEACKRLLIDQLGNYELDHLQKLADIARQIPNSP